MFVGIAAQGPQGEDEEYSDPQLLIAGIALVAVIVALTMVLVRRPRRERAPDFAPPAAAPPEMPADQATMPPAGWLTDPMGRHEQRYWDGARWTEHVSDGGTQSTDPVT